MGAVSGKNVSDETTTQSEDGRTEGSGNTEEDKTEDSRAKEKESTDRIPTNYGTFSGPLGLPRLVLTFGTIEVEDTNKQKEEKNSAKGGRGLKINKTAETKTTKKGKEPEINTNHEKGSKQEVAVQTEARGLDEIKDNKPRIKELRIKLVDSSEKAPDGVKNIVWIKEKDAQGVVHYKSCKAWSDSQVSGWTEESKSLPHGVERDQQGRISWLGRVSTRKKGKEPVKNSKKVNFIDDKMAIKSESLPKGSDEDAREIKGAASRLGSYAQLSTTEDSKESDDMDSQRKPDIGESTEEKIERSEHAEADGAKQLLRGGNANPNDTEEGNNDNARKDNPKNTNKRRSTTNDGSDITTETEEYKDLTRKCSDMGACTWSKSKEFPDGKTETDNEKAEGSERADRAREAIGETTLKPETPSEAKTEESETGTIKRKKKLRRKGSKAKQNTIKTETMEESGGTQTLGEVENEEIRDPKQEIPIEINGIKHNSMLLTNESKVKDEKQAEYGAVSKKISHHQTDARAQTVEREPFNSDNLEVMALFETEYFWKMEKPRLTCELMSLESKNRGTAKYTTKDCRKGTASINSAFIDDDDQAGYDSINMEKRHNKKQTDNSENLLNQSTPGIKNYLHPGTQTYNTGGMEQRNTLSNSSGSPRKRKKIRTNDMGEEQRGCFGSVSDYSLKKGQMKYRGPTIGETELRGPTDNSPSLIKNNSNFYSSPFTGVPPDSQKIYGNEIQTNTSKSAVPTVTCENGPPKATPKMNLKISLKSQPNHDTNGKSLSNFCHLERKFKTLSHGEQDGVTIEKYQKKHGWDARKETTESEEHRIENQSSEKGKSNFERGNRSCINHVSNGGDRKNTLTTLASLTNIADNLMPKKLVNFVSRSTMKDRAETNSKMALGDQKDTCPHNSSYIPLEAEVFGSLINNIVKSNRSSTKSSSDKISSCGDSMTTNTCRRKAKVSNRGNSESEAGEISKDTRINLETDQGNEFNQYLRTPAHSPTDHTMPFGERVNAKAGPSKIKSTPIAFESKTSSPAQQHKASNNKDKNRTNYASRIIIEEKSLSAPETGKMVCKHRIRRVLSDEDYSNHDPGNNTVVDAPKRKNVQRKRKKKRKAARELPGLKVGAPEEDKISGDKKYSNIKGTERAKGKEGKGSSRECSIVSGQRADPYSFGAQDVDQEKNNKVTGKPPICAAPKKQRELETLGRKNGTLDAPAIDSEAGREWQGGESLEEGYVGSVDSLGNIGDGPEAIHTWKDDDSGSMVLISHSLLREAGRATGSGSESSTSIKDNVLSEYHIRLNASSNKLMLSNVSDVIEKASSLSSGHESQRNSDGGYSANASKISNAKRKVSSKLLKLAENMINPPVFHENAIRFPSLHLDTSKNVTGGEEKSSRKSDDTNPRRGERKADVTVHFLREPEPLSSSRAAISNRTRSHSNVSAHDVEERETRANLTTSDDVSIRTAEFERLQEQIEVLEEKFLTLLDYVERAQEENEERAQWKDQGREEAADAERQSDKKEFNNYEAQNQKATDWSHRTPESTGYHKRAPSMYIGIISEETPRSNHKITKETTRLKKLTSSMDVNADTRAQSSTSSIWKKIRSKSSMLLCVRGNASDHSSEEPSDGEEKTICYEDLIIEETTEHHQVRAAPRGARTGSVKGEGGKKNKRTRR